MNVVVVIGPIGVLHSIQSSVNFQYGAYLNHGNVGNSGPIASYPRPRVWELLLLTIILSVQSMQLLRNYVNSYELSMRIRQNIETSL